VALTRRGVLKGLAGVAAGSAAMAGYAFGVEPALRLRVQRYALTPPGWTPGLKLRIAALADVHASEPYMSAARIAEIAQMANSLSPDLIVLLGDYTTGHRYRTRRVPNDEWAAALGICRAPLGVHAVLGNHDWWDDLTTQREGRGPPSARRALERAGIAVHENDAVRVKKGAQHVWLCGLGDQIAFLPSRRRGNRMKLGLDDLPGTLAKVDNRDPIILLAHEPDIFVKVPDRVSLTLSGHTHGGQVRLFGWSPVVPSAYGNRFAYGHIVEDNRHLIVSGGLGTSIAPVRFGVPPEIVVVDLG
jgi:hypothetical protein